MKLACKIFSLGILKYLHASCIFLHVYDYNYYKQELETVSIAEPLQNRQHARETPNAVNTRRERKWEGELKARREEEGN